MGVIGSSLVQSAVKRVAIAQDDLGKKAAGIVDNQARRLGDDVMTLAGKRALPEVFDAQGVRSNLAEAMATWSAQHPKQPSEAAFTRFFQGTANPKQLAEVTDYVTPLVSYRPRNPVAIPTKTEAKAIAKAMRKDILPSLAAYRTLNKADRKAFREVYDLLENRIDGRRALQQLLVDGRLTLGSEKSRRTNLIQALGALATDRKLDTGIRNRRSTLVAELTQELADPVSVSQHYKGTCAATSRGQIMWSLENPTDYTTFVHDLAKPEGKAKLPNGKWVTRPDDWDAGNDQSPHRSGLPGKADPNGGRSIASQLVEPVFMQVGYGPQYRYSNTFDAGYSFKGLSNKRVMDGGMYSEHEARLLESLFPGRQFTVAHSSLDDLKDSFKVVPKDVWNGKRIVMEMPEQLATLKAMAGRDHPVPVGVYYTLSGGHAVLVTGNKQILTQTSKNAPPRIENWIEYINPWGQRELQREDAFLTVMMGATFPGNVQGVVGS